MKALDDLRRIVKMRDQRTWKATEIRENALEDWINTWIVHSNTEQAVINQKYMQSEFEDQLKEAMCLKMVSDVLEESVIITKSANKIKTELLSIRRKPKEIL